MLVDNIKLTIIAGDGGNGSAHLLHDAQTSKGGPDGGNGGDGGNIYFQGSHNITDLREFRYKKKIVAASGADGKGQKMSGKNAHHITVFVPLGTRITDPASRDVYEMTDTTTRILMARGGIGGRGNVEFKTPTNQTPRTIEYGTHGEEKQLFLELRLIAEIGLIGLPNAGKSSLLAVLTHATPKIADYPFTTLEPNIGMMGATAIADIPGLIDGASKGKGLGIDFLRHIEKTKILIHCIDLTNTSPKTSYDTVRKEFKKFNTGLLAKPEYILLSKSDLVSDTTIRKTRALFEKSGKNVLTCSIYDQKSIDALKQTLVDLLEKHNDSP
ncbi:GTPase ObgE [Candidatus Gottesmanbacteria bacterium]|nr:GTPase ObgE [Candidatus Gottesmanbacteria bacterium]